MWSLSKRLSPVSSHFHAHSSSALAVDALRGNLSHQYDLESNVFNPSATCNLVYSQTNRSLHLVRRNSVAGLERSGYKKDTHSTGESYRGNPCAFAHSQSVSSAAGVGIGNFVEKSENGN